MIRIKFYPLFYPNQWELWILTRQFSILQERFDEIKLLRDQDPGQTKNTIEKIFSHLKLIGENYIFPDENTELILLGTYPKVKDPNVSLEISSDLFEKIKRMVIITRFSMNKHPTEISRHALDPTQQLETEISTTKAIELVLEISLHPLNHGGIIQKFKGLSICSNIHLNIPNNELFQVPMTFRSIPGRAPLTWNSVHLNLHHFFNSVERYIPSPEQPSDDSDLEDF